MQAAEFEKGLLVLTAWRTSSGNGVNELFAIACTLRNWVVPRPGQAVPDYKSYTEAVLHFWENYPLRGFPKVNEPTLIDPNEGLFVCIDQVYNNTVPDITSSQAFPNGARHFGRARLAIPGSWFYDNILSRQHEHPLIGTFGSQQFYG